jgi:hypothetical protein
VAPQISMGLMTTCRLLDEPRSEQRERVHSEALERLSSLLTVLQDQEPRREGYRYSTLIAPGLNDLPNSDTAHCVRLSKKTFWPSSNHVSRKLISELLAAR